MTNLFLKINKDLFNLNLNPTQILMLSQIMEFNTNTGDCYMTDKQFAEMFGVSDKTVSRELKKLEESGFITRETKNIKNGKERHIKVNVEKIEQSLAKDNLSLTDNETLKNPTDKLSFAQQTNCPLHNRQNDLIKDNSVKDNAKENKEKLFHPKDEIVSLQTVPEVEVKEEVPTVEEKEKIIPTGTIEKCELQNRINDGIVIEYIAADIIKTPIGKILKVI